MTGTDNVAVGFALAGSTATSFNTAVGARALLANTTGLENTAIGFQALLNTDGHDNTAIGSDALSINISGNGNTAVGLSAMASNSTGTQNTAIGFGAGNQITGNNNICIGGFVVGVAGENNTIRIGDNLPDRQGGLGLPHRRHFQPSDRPRDRSTDRNRRQWEIGHRRVVSRRFKRDIEPMDKVSEAILSFQPGEVSLYKSDTKRTPCFGLIAEEETG